MVDVGREVLGPRLPGGRGSPGVWAANFRSVADFWGPRKSKAIRVVEVT